MAGEIHQAHYPETDDLYVIITRLSDGWVYVVGSGFEDVGTWNNARIQACAIAMTPSGGVFYADFPTAVTDIDEYHAQVMVAAGGAGSEDISDWTKSQGQISWNVDSEVTIGVVGSILQTVYQVVDVPEPVETRTRIYI